jgi:MFS family permease
VHPGLLLAVLSLAGLAYGVLSSAVIPALPTIQHALHTTVTGTTWLLTGFLLSAAVGSSIVGRLGDMYGKEKLLLATLVVLAASTLLAAVSDSLPILILARVIQGVSGGIFPLAFAIMRDEFPADRVAGGIGLMSAILGAGGGLGIVAGGVIVQHLGWHWLFWMPLVITVIAALCVWRFVPESPIRTPGKVNWLAAALMTAGMSLFLIAIAQTTVWGWGSPKVIAMGVGGVAISGIWVFVEVRSRTPLIDMTMMRIRGVWTTNLAAFLLGAGMFAAFIALPQIAQEPKRSGFGYGASIVVSGLYLLPCALIMGLFGTIAGKIARRWGSRQALIGGSAITVSSFVILIVAVRHPAAMLASSALLGIGIGLAYSALGNLIVGAVDPTQTGVASGMNTVMRTLGGALGGQISATFIAHNTHHGLAGHTGYTETFIMSTAFMLVCVAASTLVPGVRRRVASFSAAPAAKMSEVEVG